MFSRRYMVRGQYVGQELYKENGNSYVTKCVAKSVKSIMSGLQWPIVPLMNIENEVLEEVTLIYAGESNLLF